MRNSAGKFTRLTRVWDYLMTTRPSDANRLRIGLETLEAREVPSISYDPAVDFSASNPTSGPWQYGTAPTATGAFALGGAVAIDPAVTAWGAPGLPVAFHNPAAGDVRIGGTLVLHGGELGLHPGPNGEYAAVRFTAPVATDYTVAAAFAGRDDYFGGTDAHVLVNGVEVFGGEVGAAGTGMAAPLTVTLNPGDVIDFRIGYGANGTYNNDSTALLATVTQHDGPYPIGGADAGSAAANFSPLTNTSGAWAFGYEPAGGGAFTAGTRADLAPGVVGWGDTTFDNLPGAFKNLTSQSQQIRTTATLGGGELALHPGAKGEWGVVRFVAPAAGTYWISGSFAGRDSSFGGTDAHVRVGGTDVFAAAVTDNTGVTFAPTSVHLAAGDVVEFAVGYGSNGTYFNDTTALTAMVAVVGLDPVVSVTADSNTAEGSSTPGIFRFTRTGDTSQPLTVTYLVGGDAAYAIDFQALPAVDSTTLTGTVEFLAGQSATTLTIVPIDDATLEAIETVVVLLLPDTTYVVGDDLAVLGIADDETADITGVTWEDLNGDGFRDTSERILGDQTMSLYSGDYRYITQTVSAADGSFSFTGLTGGDYRVKFNTSFEYALTVQQPGGSAAGASGFTDIITLVGSGYAGMGVLGGFVSIAPPEAAAGPTIIITKTDGKQTDKLRVAKWSDAFGVQAGKVVVRGPDAKDLDFIDRDADAFRVFVYDLAAWNLKDAQNAPAKPFLDATVGTVAVPNAQTWLDAPNTVRVRRIGTVGYYMSDTQMLVSNTVDDDYTDAQVGADEAAPAGAVGPKGFQASDRTHKVVLGGAVHASYNTGVVGPDGNAVVKTASAGVPADKVVKLNISLVKLAATDLATPAITQEDVMKDIVAMQEIYAQAGIRVELTKPIQTISPGEVNIRKGFDDYKTADRATGKLAMTTMEKELIGAGGYRTPPDANGKNDVEVLYVGTMRSNSGGVSYPASIVPDAKYADTVVMSPSSRNYGTLAHEVWHLLENYIVYDPATKKEYNPHYPYTLPDLKRPLDSVNLMIIGGIQSVREGKEIDSRRLTDGQVKAALMNRPTLVWDV